MRRIGSITPIVAVPLLVALVALTGACGGGDSDAPPTAEPGTPTAAGEQLVRQFGCLSCHTLNGKAGAGPTLKGIVGRKVKLRGGRTVTADDAYLRRAILDPAADVVDGYLSGLMVASVRNLGITPAQADQIVAYLHIVR